MCAHVHVRRYTYLHVVARSDTRHPAIQPYTEVDRGRKAQYMHQWCVNRLIQFKFSGQVMASRVMYRFCLLLVCAMSHVSGRIEVQDE